MTVVTVTPAMTMTMAMLLYFMTGCIDFYDEPHWLLR
jgi:hypothetical protein